MQLSLKLYSFSVTLTCTIGLIVQLNEVSQDYFRYQTETKVATVPQFLTKFPILSACTKLMKVIKPDKWEKMFGRKYYQSDHPNFSWPFWDEMMNYRITIADIFDLTPSVDEVTGSDDNCIIRRPGNEMLFLRPPECRKFFTISKYFHRESVCYKFTPKVADEKLRIEDFTLKDYFFGLIYQIPFNLSLFGNTTVATGAVHELDTIHLHDTMMSPFLQFKMPNETRVLFTYNTIYQRLKEPPFDTGCQVYPTGDSRTLRRLWHIQNETAKVLNRSIPDVMIGDPLNTTLLVISLMDKGNFKKTYQEIVAKFPVNPRPTCVTRSTISRASVLKYRHFVFGISWPDGLMVHIESRPKSNTIDYIVYICSCIGTWFGISVFSIFEVFKMVHGKISKKDIVTQEPTITSVQLSSANQACERMLELKVNSLSVKLRAMQSKQSGDMDLVMEKLNRLSQKLAGSK